MTPIHPFAPVYTCPTFLLRRVRQATSVELVGAGCQSNNRQIMKSIDTQSHCQPSQSAGACHLSMNNNRHNLYGRKSIGFRSKSQPC